MIRSERGGELTLREHQVAELAAAGKAVKEIAAELGISYFTAKAHLRAIYEKLGIHDRVTLAITVIRARSVSEAA